MRGFFVDGCRQIWCNALWLIAPYACYDAVMRVPDPKNSGKYLTKKSTMFPDSWTADRVKVETDAAFKNKVVVITPDGKQMWQGVTPSGVVVKGYLRPKTTVYPVL